MQSKMTEKYFACSIFNAFFSNKFISSFCKDLLNKMTWVSYLLNVESVSSILNQFPLYLVNTLAYDPRKVMLCSPKYYIAEICVIKLTPLINFHLCASNNCLDLDILNPLLKHFSLRKLFTKWAKFDIRTILNSFLQKKKKNIGSLTYLWVLVEVIQLDTTVPHSNNK